MLQHFFKQTRFKLLFILLLLFAVTPISAQFDFGGDSDAEPIVTMQSLFSYSEAEVGKKYDAAIIVKVMKHWHINSASPNQDFLIPAKLDAGKSENFVISDIQYPEPSTIMLANDEMSVYDGKLVVYFKVSIAKDYDSSTIDIPLTFSFQPCDDKTCKAPDEIIQNLKLKIGSNGTPINQEIFTQTISSENNDVTEVTAVSNNAATSAEASELQKLIDDNGVWGYFLILGIAFITGLLLSFSPCTYPMIPITVSIFAGQSRSMGRGFILSLFYVGSMAVVYGIMGLIVSLVGGVFGAWLANPYVVIGMSVVFVIFALSMFGLYNLEVPMALRNKLSSTEKKGGVGGVIILGAIAALVISPCVGPFVAGILAYISTFQDPLFGFLILFVFAVGLGTLYIIVGTFSSAITSLPGAGGWMETVKKFFGFVLLMMALYFLRTILPENVLVILTGLLLLALAVFGGGLDKLSSESPFFDRLKKFIGVLSFLIAIYLLGGSLLMNGFILPQMSSIGVSSATVEEASIDWKTGLQSGLKLAKQTGKPVIIDTWATWCVNCKVLDKKTFHNKSVVEESKRFIALKIQLEKSDTPESIEFMKQFGMKSYSLPTVLLLDSNGDIKKIITGVIGPDEMIVEMQKVK